MSFSLASTTRLREKHKPYWYWTTDSNGHKPHKGQYIYISCMRGKTLDFFTNSPVKISGEVWLMEYGQGTSGGMDSSGCPLVVRKFHSYYDIQSWLKSHNDSLRGAPFESFTIGEHTFTDSTFRAGTPRRIASYQKKDSADYSDMFSREEKVTMTDTNGKLVFSTSVYSPAILNVTNEPTSNDKGALIVNLEDALTLHWNADTNNTRGIRIEMSNAKMFDPHDPICVFTLPDNGNFTIPQKLLSLYCKNKPVDKKYVLMRIVISRGNVQIVTGTDGRKYETIIVSQFNLFFALK